MKFNSSAQRSGFAACIASPWRCWTQISPLLREMRATSVWNCLHFCFHANYDISFQEKKNILGGTYALARLASVIVCSEQVYRFVTEHFILFRSLQRRNSYAAVAEPNAGPDVDWKGLRRGEAGNANGTGRVREQCRCEKCMEKRKNGTNRDRNVKRQNSFHKNS